MTRLQDSHRRINAEIAQEKAAALGRAGERLEAALAHVTALGRQLDLAPIRTSTRAFSANTRAREGEPSTPVWRS